MGRALKSRGRRHAAAAAAAGSFNERETGSPLEWTIVKHGSETSYSSARYYGHQVLKWGASFLFGLALLFLMPGFFFDAVSACNKTAAAIGFGVLFLIATPIAAIIVCITVVGLGVGISAILLWMICIYAAQVFVGAWLGEKILGAGTGVGAAIGRLALGLAIMRVLGMLPFLGGWISCGGGLGHGRDGAGNLQEHAAAAGGCSGDSVIYMRPAWQR